MRGQTDNGNYNIGFGKLDMAFRYKLRLAHGLALHGGGGFRGGKTRHQRCLGRCIHQGLLPLVHVQMRYRLFL